jgi:hypothetical protein
MYYSDYCPDLLSPNFASKAAKFIARCLLYPDFTVSKLVSISMLLPLITMNYFFLVWKTLLFLFWYLHLHAWIGFDFICQFVRRTFTLVGTV